MSLETYTKISESFPSAHHVYLSGWGEPLLNPHFMDMLDIAKGLGCEVGFTTNGALLDGDTIQELVGLQVDLVSLSLAGATAESHGAKRVGSDFRSIIKNLTLLESIKMKTGSEKPQVIILFMMFRDNLDELVKAIKLAANIGVEGVVATNVDYVGDPVQDEVKAFSCNNTATEQSSKIRDAKEIAEGLGVRFRALPLRMGPTKICSEDPLNNLYISERGEVSPCVYLNPPVSQIPRIFCGERTVIPTLSYGNIGEADLLDIWESDGYVSFRRHYENRLKGSESSPLPQPCRTCYKAYGI
jgi:MoaA/NifB/PqqE/SkfB family radical SAM enzyme